MTCNVVVQHFQDTYHLGDTISGHLVCTFTSRESIRGLKVKLYGKEHTDWIGRESYYDNHEKRTKYRNVRYYGDNEISAADVSLIREKTLEPGRYEYPFTFTLPGNLPTSFQGCHGYVKYFIKGTVKAPFVFDQESEKHINVYAPIDFNNIRSRLQMEPCTYQDEKTICWCYCAGGPITLDVHLEKEAFVLEETAKIKIDVTNMSNENIFEMNVKLLTVIESKATCPGISHKHDTELLATTSDTGVRAFGRRTYDLDLYIPSYAAIFNFNRCTLFKQWFVLKVEAVFPGCHSNMEVEANVMIGHIPLGGDAQGQLRHRIPDSISAIPDSTSSPPPSVRKRDSQPPPYPASIKAPPYPTGPPTFPTPSGTPRQIGFSLQPTSGASETSNPPTLVPVPVPVPGVALYPPAPSIVATAANAPPEESAPSAPPKAEIYSGRNFAMIDAEDPSNGSSEPPPPSYSEAVGISAPTPK